MESSRVESQILGNCKNKGVPRSALFCVFASQNEAATARSCDLLTILIGDITFGITQVLPSAHYVGFRTQSRSPDRSKEVDAQRCGPECFERREGGSKSHAHCRVGQIAQDSAVHRAHGVGVLRPVCNKPTACPSLISSTLKPIS